MQDQIILRNHENMMEYFNNNTDYSVSLKPVKNYFWIFQFTKGILGRSSIDKMNKRIGAIPRYPVRLTVSEHRDLMNVMVFVVDSLLSNDLSEVYIKWNKMYILSRLEIFKESNLEKFQNVINKWTDLFVILFRKKSDSKMKFSKFYSWIFHIVDTIREYGAINDILLKHMKVYTTIIKQRVTEELHKTPTALIYTSKLFEFKLLKVSIFFEQQKKNLDLTENIIKGFAKFLECLDSFFDILEIISIEDYRIKIFDSITLKNINILPIAMDNAELFEYQFDNGTCYAQTLK
ncbi:hypothetical protein Glove_487g27 [Diversispora epigaea]|uniref:Uncharacterized protein n=1 Tax=Diversispora epigaea TaxID=1348612 RepID=A0A397GPK0_9GLOM|nr:hypothetical protein Glove_487g27 [Diversispora epigaea]